MPLSKTNFLWRKDQFYTALVVNDLAHVVDKSFVAPVRLIAKLPYPEYASWIETNFLVLGWMKVTISPPLCSLIQKVTFALHAWKILELTLSPESKQYTSNVKNQIRALKKTSPIGMTDYLIQMKSLANLLCCWRACHGV